MRITNIFKLEDMPESIEAQNDIVNSAFTVENVHFHNTETGEYFLVRTTVIDEALLAGDMKKLDPQNPEDLLVMNELLEALSTADFTASDE